jgi:hypothetical protein
MKTIPHESELVKVKALSKSMARQIMVVHTSYDEMTKRIVEEFRIGTIRPIAWACGEVIDGIPNGCKVWLVEFEGNLYWVNAPYGGKITEGQPG